MHEQAQICLPEHAEKFTRTLPKLRSYSREDIDDIVHGIYRAQEMSLDDTYMRLNDVYYPHNDNIDRLTTHIDELKEEMDMIQRQNAVGPEASIDGYTRPSIDDRHASLRERLVTVKLLEDKFDEIIFSQNLMREDFSQRLEDVKETIHARLRMPQGCIGNLQNRMHVNEVDKEILKNKWTRGDEAIRSFIDRIPPVSLEGKSLCVTSSPFSPLHF
ncbi:hypothetical protein F2Q69_00022317 [Brassica cretica]|uniref:Uncharacterized protein n=1 Tax=Brassica cretica TaxID=69181 RepID=A0A8S9QKF8_BRACR|nr:hypothetical protein F2Q69_00022317 [Brassica cretica]